MLVCKNNVIEIMKLFSDYDLVHPCNGRILKSGFARTCKIGVTYIYDSSEYTLFVNLEDKYFVHIDGLKQYVLVIKDNDTMTLIDNNLLVQKKDA